MTRVPTRARDVRACNLRRHESLSLRALANILLCSAALCGASCGCEREPVTTAPVRATARAGAAVPAETPAPADAAASVEPAPGAADAPLTPAARIGELIEMLTPVQETVTSDITDALFIRGQDLLAELSAAGRPVGLAALEALRTLRQTQTIEGAERILAVERGLLTVAARAAPEDTRGLLHNLTTQYGAALDLRTEAVLLYAETAPEPALEVLEPIVTITRAESTGPPAEFLVKAYVLACEKTGRSPVRALAAVATNLFQEEAARVRAVKELGRHTDPLAAQALQAILVESTGDGYLRRMAAQSIQSSLPNETACEVFTRVADKEADFNFLFFLRDMLEKNCGPK